MQASDLAGKRVVVLGLGIHGGGLAVAKWLVRQQAKITVTDTKTRADLKVSLDKLRGLPINYVLGKHPLKLLNKCDLIVQNPGVPTNHPFLQAARRKKITIENEASLFVKLCPTKKIVAVTGTRGKSTTVSLLGEILKKNHSNTIVAGNIRDVVLFDVLDKLTSDSTIVIELSSWQLEVMGQHRLRLPVAVITNILRDHLNRYKSFSNYAKAKANIFKYQQPSDRVFLNYDNLITRSLARQAKSKVYWFSLNKSLKRGCYLKNNNIYWRDYNTVAKIFSRENVKLLGEHNLANIMAAVAVAKTLKVSNSSIRQAIFNYKGLHDRLEFIRNVDGVHYYNDTTSTSPDATLAALKSFNKKIILIAGGTDKDLNFKVMAQVIKSKAITLILLPGTATVKIQSALKNYKKIFLAKNMSEAVTLSQQLAPKASIVLLSPGAASFGLFKHEFDRGEAFKKAVRNLKSR